jgi:hypothetical protein
LNFLTLSKKWIFNEIDLTFECRRNRTESSTSSKKNLPNRFLEKYQTEIDFSNSFSIWLNCTYLNDSKGKVVWGGSPGDSEMMKKTIAKLNTKLNNFLVKPILIALLTLDSTYLYQFSQHQQLSTELVLSNQVNVMIQFNVN